MSPLILVGITLLTIVLGDVSHVIQDDAHPPSDPLEASESKKAEDFWWMQDDSPFKSSYKAFKKCSTTGKCPTSKSDKEDKFSSSGADAFFGPIDLKKNIFFNQASNSQGASYASFSSSNSESGSSSVNAQTFHSGVKLDLSENPFLKGSFAHAGPSVSFETNSGAPPPSFHVSNINLGKNPFLKAGVEHNGKTRLNKVSSEHTGNEDIYRGFHIGKDFVDLFNSYLIEKEFHVGHDGSKCVGFERVCVPKDVCVNGVVTNERDAIDVSLKEKKCKENEVCCQLPSYDSITSGKSSVPGSQIKLTDIDVDQVHVLSSSQEGIRPQLNFIGASGSSTIKPIRDLSGAASETFFSSTPDYSNVHFGDDARFSNLDGLDYLPPVPPTRTEAPTPSTYRPTPPSCPPGQYLTSSGRCELIHKDCPPGTRPTPSGGCEKLRVTCGPGEQLGPYGRCVPIPTPPQIVCGPGQRLGPNGACNAIPTTPRPTPPPSCLPGQKLGPYGQCIAVPTTPRPTPPPSCLPGQKLGPYGQCIAIPTPVRPTPPPYCLPGQRLGPNGQCIDISVTPRPTPPAPSCFPGQHLNPQGVCVPIPTQPPSPPRVTCAPGQTLGPYGQCITSTYIPPVVCGHGQRLGPHGECIDITTQRVTYPPVTTPSPAICGPGERVDRYGQCKPATTARPACPPGSFPTAYGGCQRPTPTSPSPTTPCPPGTIKSPYGRCENPPTPPRPVTCPSGSFLGPSGNCVRPTPSSTTRTYLPPKTDRTTPSYTTGSTIDSDFRVTDKIPSPGNNIPIHVRPPGYNETTNINLIPVGCAAALKCVQEIYCTAEGFVSAVPVVLTKQQELLRAPTTDCRIPESGTLGKCCRDADYKDPWPSANLVNGVDDGQYAEDDSIGQYKGIGK